MYLITFILGYLLFKYIGNYNNFEIKTNPKCCALLDPTNCAAKEATEQPFENNCDGIQFDNDTKGYNSQKASDIAGEDGCHNYYNNPVLSQATTLCAFNGSFEQAGSNKWYANCKGGEACLVKK